MNSDGKTDLVAGAYGYSTNTGRVYIFHNDGSIPTTAATADTTLTGSGTSTRFGISLATGDVNADGRADLIVGASAYSNSTGRVYIFYNDGSYPSGATTADITFTGESLSSLYGIAVVTGDFNADGKMDLVVGAYGYSTITGRVYMYTFNDGVITGTNTSDAFGRTLAMADINADGKTDLIVGASGYSTSAGRVYIFYGDTSYPTAAASADVTIDGEASSVFGWSLTTGDFNADGEVDLVVGAYGYSTNTGRAYIFYNDGSIPTTAGTADVTITGEATGNYFGYAVTAGDLNADGETDLAVSAQRYSSDTGRAYIFHNDGSIPTTAATADVTITGASSNHSFGSALASGDFNGDGTIDLVAGAPSVGADHGAAYIFHNDGSIPTAAGSADVIISSGESSSNYFGSDMTSGDFNGDGRTDLVIGAYGYSTSTGRVYIFYNDGSIPTTPATADVIITGNAINDRFGSALVSGDFNVDGRSDLAIGAPGYSTNTGRAYTFYNDGSYASTAASADIILTGETTSNYFGYSLVGGDINQDGIADLALGAYGYSTSTGGVYMIISEIEASGATDTAATLRGTGILRGTGLLR